MIYTHDFFVFNQTLILCLIFFDFFCKLQINNIFIYQYLISFYCFSFLVFLLFFAVELLLWPN